MNKNILIAISIVMLSLFSVPFANAVSFSQTINEWHGDTYQKRVTFNLGKPITNITQAILETNVYDLEDDDSEFGYPPNHVDIQLNIEGYNVPGAFDTVCFRFANGTVNFNLLSLLGSDALEDICSDGIVIVDFLNAGTYQESYDINWVSLNIESGTSSPTFEVINSFPSPGDNPRGLAWDGSNLWNCDWIQQRIYQLDTSGNIIDYINWPHREAYGLTYDGSNLWVCDNTSDYVYEVSRDGEILSSFPSQSNLYGVTWDDSNLWISSNDFIYKMTKTGEVLQAYQVGSSCSDLSFDDENLWLTNYFDGTVTKLNTNGVVLEIFNVGGNPIGITWDGNYLWYADVASNMIYQVRIASGIITTSTTTSIINPITTTTTPITTTTPTITTSIGGCTYGSCVTTGECTIAYGAGWACVNGCCETTGADCPISLALDDDELQLATIRSFRDNVLKKSKEGQEIIRLYYQWSPIIVKFMERDEEFTNDVKDIIDEVLPLIR